MIMVVVVALIMLAVGVFAFFSLWSNLEQIPEFGASAQECQTVTTPGVPQTVTLPRGATVTSVRERLNTGTWQTIDSGNYSHVGTTITVNVTG